MAEVIHTIKGNEYLYVHTREGDKVVCRYVGPVGKGGKVRAAQHGGGAPSEVTQQEDNQTKEGKIINNIKDNSKIGQEAQEKSTMKTEFTEKLEPHLQRDYGEVTEIKYHPPTRGYIESNRCGVLAMRDRKTGLYYLVDGEGNAMISKDYYDNIRPSGKTFLSVLSDWETKTGNVV